MKTLSDETMLPGLEAEVIWGLRRKSFFYAFLSSLILFSLLPLSEFAKQEEWLDRKVDVPIIEVPTTPRSTIDKSAQKQTRSSLPKPKLRKQTMVLETLSGEVSLEVTPGDFKTAFSLSCSSLPKNSRYPACTSYFDNLPSPFTSMALNNLSISSFSAFEIS